MGSQQLLLLIFGVIAVGMLVAAGVMLFNHHAVASSRDAITQDLASLGRVAYGYRITPSLDGGGGGSYANFKIPAKLVTNELADFESNATPAQLVLKATSTRGYGSITAILDSTGGMSAFGYTGDFR